MVPLRDVLSLGEDLLEGGDMVPSGMFDSVASTLFLALSSEGSIAFSTLPYFYVFSSLDKASKLSSVSPKSSLLDC